MPILDFRNISWDKSCVNQFSFVYLSSSMTVIEAFQRNLTGKRTSVNVLVVFIQALKFPPNFGYGNNGCSEIRILKI